MNNTYTGGSSGSVKSKPAGQKTPKGLSWKEFNRLFPDDQAAEEWLEKVRWGAPELLSGIPSGMYCPLCGSTGRIRPRRFLKPPPTNRRPYRWRCGNCNRYFSVKTRSVMEGSNQSPWDWVLGLYELVTHRKSVTSLRLLEVLGITQRSAWFTGHRMRHALSEQASLDSMCAEVDVTYIGGLEDNKHWNKKLRAGRGTVGKTPVIGMRCRLTGKVVAKVLPDENDETLQGFVKQHLRGGGTLYSDGDPVFARFDWPGKHEAVKHGSSTDRFREWVRGDAHTNGVESDWATVKRTYTGTFHQMSPKHLQRYIDELVARHNFRQMDTLERMERVASLMMEKRLKYKDLVK